MQDPTHHILGNSSTPRQLHKYEIGFVEEEVEGRVEKIEDGEFEGGFLRFSVELSRYRCGSCASASSWRCIYIRHVNYCASHSSPDCPTNREQARCGCVIRTGWCYQSSVGSIEGWVCSASGLSPASASSGKTCGSVKWYVSILRQSVAT